MNLPTLVRRTGAAALLVVCILVGGCTAGRIPAPSPTTANPPPVGTTASSTLATVPPAAPVPAPSPPVLACKVRVSPSSDLAEAVKRAPPATTFCLGPGTYKLASPVLAKSGDAFVGTSSRRPILDAGATTGGIDAHRAKSVTVENLVVEDAQIASGRKACPSCGRGIWGGDGLRAWNIRLTGNQQNGLSGSHGTVNTWLIVGAQIIGNGSQSEVGYSSGGIKGSNGYTILNSYVANNIGIGIWCDVGCRGGRWTVEGNTVTGNTRGGIRYEISDTGALISHNLVVDNNTSHHPGLGGIEIASSGNVVVAENVLRENGVAQVYVGGNGRHGARLVNVSVRDNHVVAGTARTVVGCAHPGVVCADNVS